MKKFKLAALLLAGCLLIPVAGYTLKLRFNNPVGLKYRIKVLSDETVYVNGAVYSRNSDMSKAVLEVKAVSNNYSLLVGQYSYYQKNLLVEEAYHLEMIYDTRFYRDRLGNMIIEPRYFQPAIRNVPTFPEYDVKVGDTWTGTGSEIHEGMQEGYVPLEFQFTVMYKLLEIATNNGRVLAKISVDYNAAHFPPSDPHVFSFTGYSHAFMYFDMNAGLLSYSSEEFSFMETLRTGETVVFKGTSESIYEYSDHPELLVAALPAPVTRTNQVVQTNRFYQTNNVVVTNRIFRTNESALLNNLSNTVRTDPGVQVRQVTDGILVNLGNILFDINKATLRPEALATLQKLAKILRDYPQLDIVVSGHTDNTGNEQYNRILSEQRAKTVSDYITSQGVASHRVSYIGYGSTRPVSDNSTETGRAANRRVEIKILTDE